ncbi:hypothetical protein XELAEV_18007314mg [Xenopus laevis]|uniref:Ig-like domain-containing protein n=1 Tax=Xenopus laevis TaxID=8355 RepID=A0A974I4D6_XENLA|nr:hypothetical protein XELAEV_18007314mg [Xenopus laevis]
MYMAFTGVTQVPVIRFEPEQIVYIQGEAITIRCLAENPSTVRNYRYYKDVLETLKTNNNILTKPYSRRWDDSTESNHIALNVIERPATPSLSLQPQYSVFVIGQEVTLSCLVPNCVGVTAIILYQDRRLLPEADNFGVLDFPNNPQTENNKVQLICETSLPSTIHGYRFDRDSKELTGTAGQKENVFVIAEYNNLSEGFYFFSESNRRGCEKQEDQIYSVFSLQGHCRRTLTTIISDYLCPTAFHAGIKLYASVLVGKILVLLSLLLFYGIRVMLISLRMGKEETDPQR